MGLQPNCKEFKLNPQGKVVGVKLGITPVPNSKYEVYDVVLIDETQTQDTVANCVVLNKENVPQGIMVTMGWPGQGPTFPNAAKPGNPDNRHMITNGYDAAKGHQGPLALFVGDKNAPESDIVYGLGLPNNRHVSYRVTFRERAAHTTPGPDQPTPSQPTTPTPPDAANLAGRVKALEDDNASLKATVTSLQQWQSRVEAFLASEGM